LALWHRWHPFFKVSLYTPPYKNNFIKQGANGAKVPIINYDGFNDELKDDF
jgi:hypothetical protein